MEQDNLQKVATIETLVQNIAALKSEVLFAKSERTSELDICNKELQNSLKELQAKDYIISTITSENEDLSEKFKNQSLLWQSAQRSVQEKEETIRMLQEEITLRIDENKNMMKNIHQLEDEKVEIKKELQNAINESISLQKQLKDKEAELNNIQQALQEKIIDLSNELHNSKKVIEDYNIQRSEQVKCLFIFP